MRRFSIGIYMAILKIYGVIADGEGSSYLSWCGIEHVSLSDISDFIASLPEDDKNIDILINSRGGDVRDGWAIYDALRQSGKELTATVEGVCASMASVVLMAAPKEARFSAPHATFLLHEPRFASHSIGVDATADTLNQLAEELRIETQKFVDLYAERTGTSAERIAEILKEDREMDAEEALSLGIVGVVNTPNTALSINTNIMAKKNAIARLLERAKAMLEGAVAELRLTTTSGVELVVETDADDPKVGDNATPDGEHTLEDGRVVVVVDGVITEIREKEVTEELTEQEQAMADTIEQLTAHVEELQAEVTTLTAAQKTASEIEILDIVAKAGGEKWLKGVAVSKRTATQRTHKDSKQALGVSRIQQELEQIKSK